jgi:1-acyl-sn-glycerol-3-phosphate acyltransferase
MKRLYSYSLLAMGALFLAAICFVWGLVSALLMPMVSVEKGRRIGRLGAMRSFRLFLSTLEFAGAWRLDLRELDKLRDAGPLIIAPNHPGLLDAVLVVSRLPNSVCVMKTSLLKNFLLGPAARLARYVPNDTLLKLITHAGEELRLGGQLLLFPEGTRTASGRLGPITEAVGALARRSRVPVQAVIIETDSRFLAKGWRLLSCPDFPINVRIRLGRRFEPPADVRAFTLELERYFNRELSNPATALAPPDAAGRPIEDAPRVRG